LNSGGDGGGGSGGGDGDNNPLHHEIVAAFKVAYNIIAALFPRLYLDDGGVEELLQPSWKNGYVASVRACEQEGKKPNLPADT